MGEYAASQSIVRAIIHAIFSAACMLVLLSGCAKPGGGEAIDLSDVVTGKAASRERSGEAILRFGFDPRLDPVEEARIYGPFLGYLQARTGKRFEIRFTKREESIIDNLGTGVVQFAAIGSVSYVRANRQYGVRCLARGLNRQGEAQYRAAIFTRPDSSIAELAQLRGRLFAFGDGNSTQGYLIPRMMLLDAGIELSALKGHIFTGSHQNCADAVVARKADAGGMQDTLAADLEKRGLIRILALSPPYPSSGICVNREVDPALVEAVRQALLAFDPIGRDGPALYRWEMTEMPLGFIEAAHEDYSIVEQAMASFGLL